MSSSARELHAAPAEWPSVKREVPPHAGKPRVALITTDEALWSRIGALAESRFQLKQFDSPAAILQDDDARVPSLLVWDARGQTNLNAELSALGRRFDSSTMVSFDSPDESARWKTFLRSSRVCGVLSENASDELILDTLTRAVEESMARAVLFNEPSKQVSEAKSGSRPSPPFWLITGIAALAVIAAAGASIHFLLHRSATHSSVRTLTQAKVVEASRPSMPADSQGSQDSREPSASGPGSGAAARGADVPLDLSETAQEVEVLIEQARQAMAERRYIAPAEANALSLYRRVLALDPHNGEAQQGVDRLTAVLLERARAALDARQFEVAMQSLESARSLRPTDERLAALDARVGALRASLGVSQVQAAIMAQNFDFAAQAIDEGVRARSLSAAQATTLRESLKRQRAEAEVNKNVRLAQSRIQQNHLIDPPNDSAIVYWDRARRGAMPELVLPLSRELVLRLIDACRIAVEQHQFADAERLLAGARQLSAPPVLLQTLQHDIAAARDERVSRAAMSTASPNGHGPQVSSPAKAVAVRSPSLVLLAPLNPIYPRKAELDGVEGWVDLTFVVMADGKTSNVQVVDASPKRTFDEAALDAIRSARYKPWSPNDQSATRKARVRLTFRAHQ